MQQAPQTGSSRVAKRRVVKAAAVRRAELLDCAQQLFLTKGYERTTINDVIAATGLSKGAFYHHFAAKEDLLEAIAARFGRDAMAYAAAVDADASLDALQRLNRLLALSREWKVEHLPQLRAMFTTLMRPQNAVLYHRIVGAVFAAMAPTITAIIEQGQREGVFDVGDARTAAEALLWLGESRRVIVMEALSAAEAGAVDEATDLIMHRVRAEEAIIDRILGLSAGSIDLAGPSEVIRAMLQAWSGG
jgi:AcrR family transcriptional regulator